MAAFRRIAWIVIVSVTLMLIAGCNSGRSQNNKAEQQKWSVRMANTVMTQADSLIRYVSGKPKWAYDVAFLGMAIDRLRETDPKYSKYMEDWVSYFIHDDGSYEYYVNEKRFDNDTKGVAPFILAALELDR